MRNRGAVFLFAAFVLWSSYKGFWIQHDIFPTEQACKKKARYAASEWWAYWYMTTDPTWDEFGGQYGAYEQAHRPLYKGKYSCWPADRDLMEQPPAKKKLKWPTMQGQQP